MENKVNEEFGGGGERGIAPERLVAYAISAVEGFADEATVRRYAELAGPAIARFGGRFIGAQRNAGRDAGNKRSRL